MLALHVSANDKMLELCSRHTETLHFNNAVVNVVIFRHKNHLVMVRKLFFCLKKLMFYGTITAGHAMMTH